MGPVNGETDIIQRRIDKLDSFFLWVSSLSFLGFSILVVYLKLPPVPYLPVFGMVAYSIAISYISGAILSDSFTERIRGWNYLFLSLSFYTPIAIMQFFESQIQAVFYEFPNYKPFVQLIIGLVIPIIYIILNKRLATPRIYQSFKKTRGKVTNRIMGHTFFASIDLGGMLYILAFAVYEMKTDLVSLLLYILFLIAFTGSLYIEEKTIRTLLRLERYQDCIEIESVKNEDVRKVSLAFIASGLISFVVLWRFGVYLTPNSAILLLLLSFGLSSFGLVFSMFFVFRGYEVRLNDKGKKGLSENQLKEIRDLLSRINEFNLLEDEDEY